jgi:hypothetical protein
MDGGMGEEEEGEEGEEGRTFILERGRGFFQEACRYQFSLFSMEMMRLLPVGSRKML